MCLERLINPEFDHIQPFSCGGSNLESNIQALCIACHKLKTGEEQGFHRSSWFSELSTDLLEAFVEAGNPLQLVYGDGTAGCLELDIVKCRRWAVEKSVEPIPIFAITDVAIPFQMEHLDYASYFYIDAGAPNCNNPLLFTMYGGPRWYPRELARFIGEIDTRNLAGERVCTDHFVASLSSHETLQASEVATTYRLMEDAVKPVLTAMDNQDVEGDVQMSPGMEASRADGGRSSMSIAFDSVKAWRGRQPSGGSNQSVLRSSLQGTVAMRKAQPVVRKPFKRGCG